MLSEELERLLAARLAFVSARKRMNDARPDPFHATPGERALYDERCKADHEAERALRSAAQLFAMWLEDNRTIIAALREAGK